MSSDVSASRANARVANLDHALKDRFDQHFSVELALSAPLIDEVLALRYQVYCQERVFEDAACFPDGRERDDYDYRSVHALVRHRDTKECVAAVRLVLSEDNDPAAPFPVEQHCAHAMPETAEPVLAETPRMRVAEISRLAVSRELRQQVAQINDKEVCSEQEVFAHIAVGLFTAVVRLSAKLGITHWLAVMEPTLLRLLKRYGIHFGHVGETVNYHGRRKPAVAEANTLVRGIRKRRPDVWAMMTTGGTITPPRPRLPSRIPADNESVVAKGAVAG